MNIVHYTLYHRVIKVLKDRKAFLGKRSHTLFYPTIGVKFVYGPAGVVGPPGSQGKQGATGPQGPRGNTGIQVYKYIVVLHHIFM